VSSRVITCWPFACVLNAVFLDFFVEVNFLRAFFSSFFVEVVFDCVPLAQKIATRQCLQMDPRFAGGSPMDCK